MRVATVVVTACLAGCAGAGQLPNLAGGGIATVPQPGTTSTAAVAAPSQTGSLPNGSRRVAQIATPPAEPTAGSGGSDVPASALASIGDNLGHVEAAPAEVYARIVRGTRGCWFGREGVLQASHILHADALPAEKGGNVVVTIHQRAQTGGSVWGAKALGMTLSPSGAGTPIDIDTTRLSPALASSMRADLDSWAHGRPSCRMREASALVASKAGPPLPVRKPKIAKRRARKPARSPRG